MFNKTKFILFTSLSAFLFFSCSNFLEGAKLKEEVENKIAYANSSAVEIQIKSESGTGTVSPNQNVYKKQSDAIDLRFDPNKEYVFLGWQAYQNGTPVNAIEFDDPNALETVARIKSISSGLMIVPKCASRPTVISTDPSSTSIPTATISVKFDQAMDINSFRFKENEVPGGATPLYDGDNTIYAYEDNLGRHYKNIKITSGGNTNRNSYYGNPVLDYTGETLMIPVNIENVPTASFGTVTVTIDKNAYAKTSVNSTMTGSHIFSFKFVDGADTEKPTISGLNVTYPESEDELVINQFLDNPRSQEYGKKIAELNSRKNILSSISISCKAKDNYGVAGIKVTEQLIRGASYTSQNLGGVTTYTITDGYTIKKIDGEDYKIWTSYAYNLQGKADGLIKLSFAVVDSAGNETPWPTSYLVISDAETSLTYCKIYNIENSLDILKPNLSAKDNINFINEALREIHVEIGEPLFIASGETKAQRESCLFRNPEDYIDMYIMAGTDKNNMKRYDLEFEKRKFTGEGFDLLTFKTKIDPLNKNKDTIIQLVVTEIDGSKKITYPCHSKSISISFHA